jgi:hypothetical protein
MSRVILAESRLARRLPALKMGRLIDGTKLQLPLPP